MDEPPQADESTESSVQDAWKELEDCSDRIRKLVGIKSPAGDASAENGKRQQSGEADTPPSRKRVRGRE